LTEPIKILGVDDEADFEALILQRFRRQVRDREYAFRFAHHGAEALDALAAEPDIQLMLLDINMPVMDGLTLLTELRERKSPVRAIMVREFKPYGTISYDGMGSVIVKNGTSGPRIMLDAHMDELGGMVAAVKLNYPQREIADAAFALQQEIDAGERVVVGVNSFLATDEQPIPTLRVDPALERKQIGRLQAARAGRDGAAVERALAALREDAAHEDRNLMEPLLACARAHASEGEIVQSLQQVFGDYAETPVF